MTWGEASGRYLHPACSTGESRGISPDNRAIREICPCESVLIVELPLEAVKVVVAEASGDERDDGPDPPRAPRSVPPLPGGSFHLQRDRESEMIGFVVRDVGPRLGVYAQLSEIW